MQLKLKLAEIFLTVRKTFPAAIRPPVLIKRQFLYENNIFLLHVQLGIKGECVSRELFRSQPEKIMTSAQMEICTKDYACNNNNNNIASTICWP